MKELLLTLLHLAVMTAKRCGPGGVRAVIAQNLRLKQQLIVLRRGRQRAPNLALSDRLICALGSLLTVTRAEPNNVRRASHCRDLVQLPVTAEDEFETDSLYFRFTKMR
jgi:hypothetical protein